jgi:hypothetical protein
MTPGKEFSMAENQKNQGQGKQGGQQGQRGNQGQQSGGQQWQNPNQGQGERTRGHENEVRNPPNTGNRDQSQGGTRDQNR